MKEANEIKSQEEFEKEFPKQIDYIVGGVFEECIALAHRFCLDERFVIESVCSKLQRRKNKELEI